MRRRLFLSVSVFSRHIVCLPLDRPQRRLCGTYLAKRLVCSRGINLDQYTGTFSTTHQRHSSSGSDLRTASATLLAAASVASPTMSDVVGRTMKSMTALLIVAGLLTTSTYPALYTEVSQSKNALFGNVRLPDWFQALNAISYALSLLAMFAGLFTILNLTGNTPDHTKGVGGIPGILYAIAVVSFSLSLFAAAAALIIGTSTLLGNTHHAALTAFVASITTLFFLISTYVIAHLVVRERRF